MRQYFIEGVINSVLSKSRRVYFSVIGVCDKNLSCFIKGKEQELNVFWPDETCIEAYPKLVKTDILIEAGSFKDLVMRLFHSRTRVRFAVTVEESKAVSKPKANAKLSSPKDTIKLEKIIHPSGN